MQILTFNVGIEDKQFFSFQYPGAENANQFHVVIGTKDATRGIPGHNPVCNDFEEHFDFGITGTADKDDEVFLFAG